MKWIIILHVDKCVMWNENVKNITKFNDYIWLPLITDYLLATFPQRTLYSLWSYIRLFLLLFFLCWFNLYTRLNLNFYIFPTTHTQCFYNLIMSLKFVFFHSFVVFLISTILKYQLDIFFTFYFFFFLFTVVVWYNLTQLN